MLVIKQELWDQRDGSEGKGTYWQSEFDPCVPHSEGGRGETAPESCP